MSDRDRTLELAYPFLALKVAALSVFERTPMIGLLSSEARGKLADAIVAERWVFVEEHREQTNLPNMFDCAFTGLKKTPVYSVMGAENLRSLVGNIMDEVPKVHEGIYPSVAPMTEEEVERHRETHSSPPEHFRRVRYRIPETHLMAEWRGHRDLLAGKVEELREGGDLAHRRVGNRARPDAVHDLFREHARAPAGHLGVRVRFARSRVPDVGEEAFDPPGEVLALRSVALTAVPLCVLEPERGREAHCQGDGQHLFVSGVLYAALPEICDVGAGDDPARRLVESLFHPAAPVRAAVGIEE